MDALAPVLNKSPLFASVEEANVLNEEAVLGVWPVLYAPPVLVTEDIEPLAASAEDLAIVFHVGQL